MYGKTTNTKAECEEKQTRKAMLELKVVSDLMVVAIFIVFYTSLENVIKIEIKLDKGGRERFPLIKLSKILQCSPFVKDLCLKK